MQNATVAEFSEFPFIATIFADSNSRIICDAILLNHKWFLTAGHCINNQSHTTLDISIGNIIYDVNTIISHPDLNSTTRENNLAVLEINGSVNFGSFIKPIELFDESLNNEIEYTAVSYDRLTYQIQYAKLTKKSCDGDWYKFNTSHHFCSSEPGICWGHSGAAAVYNDKLIGITVDENDCTAKNRPSLFISLNNYISWIRQVIN